MAVPFSMSQALMYAAMTLIFQEKLHTSVFFPKSLGNVSIVYIYLVSQSHHRGHWLKSDLLETFHLQFHAVQARYIKIQNASAAACR